MTQEGQLPPPPVMWAQRRNILFVTICLEDCKDPILKVEPETLYFKGGRTLELVLFKKVEGPYWPRLTKEKTKAHWLKSDFNKWKDEDDSEDEGDFDGGNCELEDMMRHMGGLGGSGDSKPNFDDLGDDVDEVDSDDEALPDLE
ncbi:hypothetical protein KPH14_009831 [Odynerus spinipes]|uniref:Uncharacterized protein n=1 Tax=Odynerus spinipes TaxID=1348599 RepID=A0AAD9VU52_9HYME|nr:hypothetical protein KPH14_009831 [Odynerus spinipes]